MREHWQQRGVVFTVLLLMSSLVVTSYSSAIYWNLLKPKSMKMEENDEVFETTDFGKLRSVSSFEVDINDLEMR